MKKLIFTILSMIIFLSSTSFAHKEWVHQYIVKQAYLLLENHYGKMPALFEGYFKDINGNFYTSGAPSHPSISSAIGGAWAEDHSDIVFGYCGFPIPFTECASVSASHFWNPDLTPYALNSLEYTSGQFENAFKKAEIMWAGNQNIIMPGPFSFPNTSTEQTALVNKGFSPYETYAFLKIKYNTLPDLLKNRKYYITGVVTIYNTNVNFDQPIEIVESTYYLDLFFAGNIIGRLCHLLADMSVPAHVRIRSHPCDVAKGDRYEMEIGGKWWSAVSASCNSIPASFPAENWTYQNAINQGGVIDAWAKNNPMKYLFYTTAQITDVYNCYRYPDETFAGNRSNNLIDQYTGDNYSEMANLINNIPIQFNSWTEELNSTASNSLVYAIRATAALLYWFKKEVYDPKPLTFAYLSGTYTLYQGATGNWYVQLGNGLEPFTYQWEIMYLDGAGYLQNYESVKKEKEKREKDKDKKKDGDITIEAVPSNYWFSVGTNSPTFSRVNNGSDLRDFNLRCIVTDGSNTTKTSNEFYVDVVADPPPQGNIIADNKNNDVISLAKDSEEISIPTDYALNQNYPNPFNPTTKISYSLPDANFVTLKIYDMLGSEVATLVNENKPAGKFEVEFDASRLSSGTYVYKLIAGNYQLTKKMQLVK